MTRSARAGEMRTRIMVKSVTTDVDPEGYPIEIVINVFGEGNYARCKWVNAHGSDVYENQRLELGQTATITMRYTPLITPTCKVWYETETGDEKAWDIVSVNDVESSHKFLEFTVKRKVPA